MDTVMPAGQNIIQTKNKKIERSKSGISPKGRQRKMR